MSPVGDLYQYMLRVNIEGFMYIHCTTGFYRHYTYQMLLAVRPLCVFQQSHYVGD